MTLAILLDMNLSPEWASTLTAAGLTAVHWSDIGDLRATDAEIMAWAIAHQHVVMTHDLDFGTLLALTHATGPSVIQVRTRETLPQQLGPMVLSLLAKYEQNLIDGALIVVDEYRSRVRILPL